MKIAILHEMFIKLWWAEKVVENWMNLFPEADLFTLIYDEKKVGKVFPKEKINTQVFWLKTQKTYKLLKKQRFCLPFMASSIENLDFSEYDVVLCSSSGFAHWAITKPETKFIVYYHSPARYMWDWTNEYKKDLWLNNSWKKYILKPFINKQFLKLRQWDYIASNRVDVNLANSWNTRNRIMKYYRKDSQVLFPPVETNRFAKNISEKYEKDFENYYIIISTLTEFKKIEIAIKWFNKIKNSNLLIIWWWDYKDSLNSMIDWKNIKFAWTKYGDELVYLVQNSKWLIFPWEEDFWIVPVEVMAAWKPIFAYKWGWLLETVISWETWDFFNNKEWEDFIEKFEIFNKNNEEWKYLAENCKKQAEKFSDKIFEEKIKNIIKQ